jgi:hypothetical protein
MKLKEILNLGLVISFKRMNFLSLIESKREGKILAPEEIQEFIREFTAEKISDYQMAAMLMTRDYFSDSKIFSAAARGFSAA